MLQLSSDQMQQLEQLATVNFLTRLSQQLAPLHGAVIQAMGERYPQFLSRAVASARDYGLMSGAAVATFVNHWFVWGEAFETQTGFEWALEILQDSRRSEHVKIHQLSHRTEFELAQRGVPPAQGRV